MSARGKIEYMLKHNPWILTTFETIGSALFRFLGHFIKTDENLVCIFRQHLNANSGMT